MSDSRIYDVVIAGAGPVGLWLACELRLGGASVLVLERSPEAGSPLKDLPFGMRGLSCPTVDAFYRRGLLDALMAADGAPPPLPGVPHARRPAGHFAGISFYQDKVDTARWPWRVPGPAPLRLATTMRRVESVLAARAAALGVDVRRGGAVEGCDDEGDAVTVSASGERGPERLRARWLVGCDGGHSTVRKLAGIGFAGTAPAFTGYSVQVELDDPDRLAPGRHFTPAGMVMVQGPGVIAMADFDGGAYHRSAPITLEHVQAVFRRIAGFDAGMTRLVQAATWTDRACQATDYRKGRILLAGDAAHIHAPLGGQGLNLGIGDAMNLGWKLAATVRGDAPAGLLDSYAFERRPVGARVLDWSRAQVALLRPDPGTRALAAIVGELADTIDGATCLAERLWGVSLSHDLGGGHPLVGRSMPDFALDDGTRCGDRFRDGQGVLLDFGPERSFQAAARQWDGRIAYVAAGAADTLGLGAVLVRPDGVVAWAVDAGGSADGLAESMRRWFGPRR